MSNLLVVLENVDKKATVKKVLVGKNHELS